MIRLNKEIGRLDLGLEGMHVVPDEKGPRMMFKHDALNADLAWIFQSHGTREFIRIFPYIQSVLEQGGVAIIDELDLAVHPLILPEIVRWFYDPARNPHDAQLWMSCHAASLLDDLCKEEVILVEKDRKGRTSAFRLTDVHGVRPNDNLYRKYLGGVYGAVPNIG